jgi:undecaprenyl-diphosphatase
MTYIGAIILGIVEGATEFIPVSSSGHLIIVRKFLGLGEGGLAFDAVLQLSTTFAIIIYFWRDIFSILKIFTRYIFFGARIKACWLFSQVSRQSRSEVSKKNIPSTNFQNFVEKEEVVLVWAIVLGTIPAIIFGLLLESRMDTIFRNVNLVALTLILGSFLFWYAQKVSKQHFDTKGNSELSVWRGIKIGFFQCLALVPGVSRSGATISGGLLSGLSQEQAVRFSFLLSIPILLGAGMKKFLEIKSEVFSGPFFSPLLVGSIVSFFVGLLAIHFLITYLKNHNLNIFIWYRIGLAIAIFLIF